MDATTRKLADLLRQVPQPDGLVGLAPAADAKPADPDFVAHQNTTSVAESLSGPATRTDVDLGEAGQQDTGSRLVASIPLASSPPQAPRDPLPSALPVTAGPVLPSVSMLPRRPEESAAPRAQAQAKNGSTDPIRRTDQGQSGLSRRFAPVRIVSRGNSEAADPGDATIVDRSTGRQAAGQQLRVRVGKVAQPAPRAPISVRAPVRLAGPVVPPLAVAALPSRINPNACSGRLQIVKRGDRIIRVLCDPRTTGSIAVRPQNSNAGFFSRLFGGDGNGGGLNSGGSVADNAGPASHGGSPGSAGGTGASAGGRGSGGGSGASSGGVASGGSSSSGTTGSGSAGGFGGGSGSGGVGTSGGNAGSGGGSAGAGAGGSGGVGGGGLGGGAGGGGVGGAGGSAGGGIGGGGGGGGMGGAEE